ncbi:MAG: S9 family peptidase, partial [Bacteroidetes bacterium 4572_117]
MKEKTIFLLSFMLFIALFITPISIAQDVIPLEDFFKNPEKSSYQISPDGKYFSYRAPYKTRMNVFVQKVGSKKAVRITSVTDRDIAGYYWANPKTILYLKDSGGDENYSIYAADRSGKNEKCLTCIEGVRTQIIDDLEDMPDEMIIGLNKRDKRVFDAYRLNIKTGKMDMIAENPGNIQGWMTDHEGKLRVAIAVVDGINSQILYRENESSKFKAVYTGNFKEALNPLFFTFDNKKLYVSSNLNRDKSAIYTYDVANNKLEDLIFENDRYDVAGLAYSKKRKVLTSVSWTSWKRQKHFLDETTKNLYKRLEKDLGEYEIAITGLNKNEDKMIIRTYSDRSLGAYYLFNVKTDKLEKIVDVSPWIDENKMAVQKPIKYIARDGLEIEGYLTLPKGVDP